MLIQQKIERAEKILSDIHEWLRSADQKIETLLAIEGIILTIIVPNYLGAFVEKEKTGLLTYWQEFFILFSLELLAFSVCRAAWGIMPRLGKKKFTQSPLYFGDIKKYTIEKYKDTMQQMTSEEYHDALLEQIYINSGLAKTKHTASQDAVVYFLLGFFSAISCYVWVKFF